MKIKHSNSNQNTKKKRLSFSAMLDSEYLFHRSAQIHMALKSDRILSKDFHIKRAKSKIDTGKKKQIKIEENENSESNLSVESLKDEKKDIPLELYFLLLEYNNKFLKENVKFHSIKEYNDAVLSFWHYINKTNPKKERQFLFKKFFPENDDNVNNLYSDEIQKLSLNLFKSNPLLSYNNFSEIFFHYLSEFKQNCKDENKLNNVKQKIAKFLEKLKDYLEYIEIMQDSDIDSISRDIKIKNSKYIKEYGLKIKNEMIKLREKRYLTNKKDIKDSTKMINDTKNTLNCINENKNTFEDPKNFDPIYSYNFNTIRLNKSRKNNFFNKISLNNYKTPLSNSTNTIRFFSPNNKTRMNSTNSTGFLLSDKKFFPKSGLKATINKIININQNDKLNNDNSDQKLNNILRYSKINSNYKNTKRRRYSSTFIDIKKKNKLISSLKHNQNSPHRKQSSGKNIAELDVTSARNSIYSSIENDDKNKKIKNKDYLSTSKLIKINKKNNRISFSPISKESSFKNNYISKKYNLAQNKKSLENLGITNSLNINVQKSQSLFNIKKPFDYNKYKDPLIVLYEDIKKKQQMKKTDIDNIKQYLKSKGKTINLDFNSMDIIKQAKRVTNRLDIEKKTKRVFQSYLTYKQIQKLDNLTKLNDKVYKLDIDYMNHIVDFKSKNSESIQANL